MNALPRALALCASLLAAVPAHAWQQDCYRYTDTAGEPDDYFLISPTRDPLVPRLGDPAICQPGPEAARNRWIGPREEHRRLFVRAMERAGLPASLLTTRRLRTFTTSDVVRVGSRSWPSIRPTVPWDSVRAVTVRPLTVAEFAGLPDHSYSLADWAAGHEECPVPGLDADPVACHTFASHMGPVNSNHFLPQSQGFYQHYHRLALDRASQCRAMNDALRGESPRFDEYVRDCETEALVLEAVGQHFLEDAWSSGHMWQRWGSPEFTDFPPNSLIASRRAGAALIAATAGIIHGARLIAQPILGGVGWDIDDAMCAPVDVTRFGDPFYRDLGPVRWRIPTDGSTGRAVGDLYTHDLLFDTDYATQSQNLDECAVSGVLEVYAATAEAHGTPHPSTPGVGVNPATSPRCWSQRATNATIALGAGINYRNNSGQEEIFPLDGAVISRSLPLLTDLGAETFIPPPQTVRWRTDVARIVSTARRHAIDSPEGTDLANGDLGHLLGVPPNGRYLIPARKPVSYSDPPLPWPGDPTRPTEEAAQIHALLGVFHRAHADDWCRRVSTTELAWMQTAARDPSADAPTHAAACEACAEFAARHLRQGTGPGSYDTTLEPLCHHLLPPAERGASRYVYQRPRQGADVTSLARSWCGCADALVLTAQGVARVGLEGATVTRLPIGSDPSGGFISAGTRPRSIAAVGRNDPRTLVTNYEGTVSVIALDRGLERELDTDHNPLTTSAGAPAGVTRISVGAMPEGIAVTPDGRTALVAVSGTDEVAVIDLDTYFVCKRFRVGPDAVEGNDLPFDLVTSADGRRAWVSLQGTTSSPGRFVERIDLARAADCSRVGGEVLGRIVTRTTTAAVLYPGDLALSPDGRTLAVAGQRTNTLLLVDTATDTPVTVMGSDGRSRDILTPRGPTSIAWRSGVGYLYVGALQGVELTDLSANGVVRYLRASDGAFAYDVGVNSAVWSMALSDDEAWIYAATATGSITALSRDLWDGSSAHRPTATSPVGGCIDASRRVAVPCPLSLFFPGGPGIRALLRL